MNGSDDIDHMLEEEEAMEVELLDVDAEVDFQEPPLDEEIDEGVLGEAGKNWERPAIPPLIPAKHALGATCV